jgi:hypothetical protein
MVSLVPRQAVLGMLPSTLLLVLLQDLSFGRQWCIWMPPALVRSFGGVPLFGKFGGSPGVSASIPPFQWVLFPQWPRPFSSVFGCSQLPGLSSGVFEVGESSKGIDPKENVVVYPKVVKDSRSCFRTMGVSFVGSDQKGFMDFLTLIEDERYDSDSPPKKVKEIKRKKRGQESRMFY